MAIRSRIPIQVRRRRLRRPPVWLFPRMVERRYAAFLRRETEGRLRTIVNALVIPRLRFIHQEATMLRPDSADVRVDQWPEDVEELIKQLTIDMAPDSPDVRRRAQDVALDLNVHNRRQWSKILTNTVGTDIFTDEPWLTDQLQTFVTQNVSLIDKAKADAARDLEGIIQRGMQTGARVETIEAEIRARVKSVGKRAKLIARDQLAKANSQITKLRQQSIGVSEYRWRTSKDERVRGKSGGRYANARPKHSSLEGKRCRWNDPTVYIDQDGNARKRSGIEAVELHPGEDYQCRCTAEPILDELLAGI